MSTTSIQTFPNLLIRNLFETQDNYHVAKVLLKVKYYQQCYHRRQLTDRDTPSGSRWPRFLWTILSAQQSSIKCTMNLPDSYLEDALEHVRVGADEAAAVQHHLLLQHCLYHVVRLDARVDRWADLGGRGRLIKHCLLMPDHAHRELSSVISDIRTAGVSIKDNIILGRLAVYMARLWHSASYSSANCSLESRQALRPTAGTPNLPRWEIKILEDPLSTVLSSNLKEGVQGTFSVINRHQSEHSTLHCY